MGISIGTVTQGYSQMGAEAFKQKIHQEAIIETKSKLGNIGGITSALEAGWQGQAELNFVTNLQNGIKKVQTALDQLDVALDAEFAQIGQAWKDQDAEMVKLDD
jgi:uncharacterized protein YukE